MSRVYLLRQSIAVLAALLAISCRSAPPEACTTPDACVVVDPGASIRIGIAAPFTGARSVAGVDILQGAQLAALNAGLFHDHNFELVEGDEVGTPEEGAAVARNFVSDPTITAVVGHAFSGGSEVAMPIYEEALIPMVSPSATRADLTQRGSQVFNRMVPNDNLQGEVAAYYLSGTLGISRVAILYDNGVYGQGLAERSRDILNDLGAEVVAFEAITPGLLDYSDTLADIAVHEPQAIFFGGYEPEAAHLAVQLVAVGLDDVVFFGGDAIYSDSLIVDAGDSAEGFYATGFAAPPESPLKDAFDQNYLDTFNVEPGTLTSFTWTAYDAANVLIEAIKQVAIVTEDGRLYIPRAALVAAVRATSGYQGLTGTISCDQHGECSSGTFDIFVVRDSTWVKIEP